MRLHLYAYLLLMIGIMFLAACTSMRSSTAGHGKRNVPADRHASRGPESGESEYRIRLALIQNAKTYIGVPYRYGGQDRRGFDCSGLISHVMRSQNLTVPRTSIAMAQSGTEVRLRDAQPGDLVFFGPGGRINHVGMVIQNGGRHLYVIHSTSSSGVRIDEVLHSSYWGKRIKYARDVISGRMESLGS